MKLVNLGLEDLDAQGTADPNCFTQVDERLRIPERAREVVRQTDAPVLKRRLFDKDLISMLLVGRHDRDWAYRCRS